MIIQTSLVRNNTVLIIDKKSRLTWFKVHKDVWDPVRALEGNIYAHVMNQTLRKVRKP